MLFTAATFASATLLFLVQPMVAKVLLPELGGSAAVWNTASVFFQAVLLAGYAFAHVSLRTLGPRRQPWLQLAVIAVGLAVLPIALPGGWQAPVTGSPIGWPLRVLAAMVGRPCFVRSTVSPTLQRWFSTTDHPDAEDPYFLYAAGNVGSLLALLGYPLIIEPRVALDDQARWWALGYAGFFVLAIACAVAARRRGRPEQPSRAVAAAERPPLAWATRLRWIGFAAVPSALMLGVTRHISSEVAAMLTDAARCQVVLVALPETTPINEAVETAYALEERVGVHLGPIVVNGVDSGPALAADSAPEGSPMRLAAEFRNARRAMHEDECIRLGHDLALPQLILPIVAGSHLTSHSVDALADEWATR